MEKEEFTSQKEFQDILKKAANLRGKRFSDITDSANNYYVDLVQEGGGVLGIALVGYTYVLETAGIRFFHLAGTSAGAINTLAMGGLGPINDPKSEDVLDALAKKNLFDFVDGDKKLKKILQRIIDGKPFKKEIVNLLFNIRKIKKALVNELGLNPGLNFEKWLNGLLKAKGVETIGDLIGRRKRGAAYFPSDLFYTHIVNEKEIKEPVLDDYAHLHIITADLTTQSKVQFPRMAKLYWGEKVWNQAPAKMVRASMSVPFFFKPFEIDNIPNAGKQAGEDWNKYTRYKGLIPKKVKFVDGGMISNFPINVFHSEDTKTPRKPTLGVKLSTSRKACSDVDDLGGFVGSMVNTMRHDADNEFLIKNPDFEQLICHIDADKEYNWLNFNMSPEKKKKLFILGAQKALEFITKFNWEHYKNLRIEQAKLKSNLIPTK